MRAQLLAKALRARGADVSVITTSDDGQRFLAGFDVASTVLSRHYAVQFDARQNMLREATDANVARYLFLPTRMLRDLWRLRAVLRENRLVINDSFHPALLFAGCLPGWRRKVVHVHGESLREALVTNFRGRLPDWVARAFGRLVAWQIDASRARLVHDFAYPESLRHDARSIRLPTPVSVARADPAPDAPRRAAVYLNPHFRDAGLALALERGLAAAGLQAHCVGEGFATRAGWLAHDTDWVDRAAGSALIVSAPGMAALAVALVYRRPILLVLTDQPEQRANAAKAAALGLRHRVVTWEGDAQAFASALRDACQALRADDASAQAPNAGRERAAARLQTWASTILALAD